MKLSQFDAAEEALSQSLSIETTLHPHGHNQISLSETKVGDTC